MGNCFLYKRGFGGGFGGGGITPEVEKTASGKGIAILDSVENPLKGLRLFGKTTQNGTPSPENPVPLESVGDGGSVGVTVCGKNLFNPSVVATREANDIFTEVQADGTIKLTGTPSRSIRYIKPADDVFIRLGPGTYTLSPSNFSLEKARSSELFSGKFTLLEETPIQNAFFTLDTNVTYDEYISIQLEYSHLATEYEPYKSQTLTLSTPNGLPGIHVSEGGNYTDENGWQWICDEVDFARGKYVQRVGRKSGSNIAWEVNAWTDDCVALVASISDVVKLDTNDDAVIRCMSTAFVGNSGANRLSKNCISVISEKRLYLLVSQSDIGVSQSNSYSDNSEAIDTWWKSFGNVSVYYQLETPIITDLTAEELAQYAALHTYSPSTTIYNDAGSYMEVKYMAKGG